MLGHGDTQKSAAEAKINVSYRFTDSQHQAQVSRQAVCQRAEDFDLQAQRDKAPEVKTMTNSDDRSNRDRFEGRFVYLANKRVPKAIAAIESVTRLSDRKTTRSRRNKLNRSSMPCKKHSTK